MDGPSTFPFFRRALRRAAATVTGNRPLGRVFSAATALLGSDRSALRRVREDARAVLRLVREARVGHYRTVPKRSLTAALAALIYLVNPLDLIPDLIPMLGFFDDAAIIAWVVSQIRRDLDAFLAWEREWGGAIDVAGEEVAPSAPAPFLPAPRSEAE